MNKLKTASVIVMLLALTSCDKQKDCPECFTPPPSIAFTIVDADNGTNLLASGAYNPDSVQLYYYKDTRKEKVPFQVVPANSSDPVINAGEVGWLSASGQKTFYLYLNAADTDTLTIDVQEKKGDCCTSFDLKAFQVNGHDATFDNQKYVYLLEK